jgi:hypothetical protein
MLSIVIMIDPVYVKHGHVISRGGFTGVNFKLLDCLMDCQLMAKRGP